VKEKVREEPEGVAPFKAASLSKVNMCPNNQQGEGYDVTNML
jgi:hypothetical protein